MNSIAEIALAQARKRGNAASALRPPVPKVAKLVPVAASVEPPVQSDVGHFSRLLYLEGRRHALDIVRGSRGLLDIPGGGKDLVGRLRQCMQGKPESFARGVAEIIETLEQEVGHG